MYGMKILITRLGVKWPTFPERLENDISWKIYQNELTIPTGLSEEDDGPTLILATSAGMVPAIQYQVHARVYPFIKKLSNHFRRNCNNEEQVRLCLRSKEAWT
jgi:hypothetical protein